MEARAHFEQSLAAYCCHPRLVTFVFFFWRGAGSYQFCLSFRTHSGLRDSFVGSAISNIRRRIRYYG